MISLMAVNVLHNAAFRIWDYGAGPFTTADDRLANRWTLRLTSGTCSIAPVTHGSSTAYPKLIRSEQGMRITVSGTPTNPDEMKVNQYIPKMEYNAPTFAHVSGAFFAADGATFEVGVGENLITVTGKGASELVTFHQTVAIDDIGTAGGQGEVVAFQNPSATGDYDLAFMQVEYLRPDENPSPFAPVSAEVDRLRMLPFCRPIGGMILEAKVGPMLRWGFTNTIPMRTTPTFYPVITSNLVARKTESTATTDTATTPTYTLSNTDEYGGLFRIEGWSSLAADDFYRVEGGTCGVLDADF